MLDGCYIGPGEKTLAEVIGTSDDNKASRKNASPWPDVETGAIVFLLDARDDFEAGLLRDWVESQKPVGESHPAHSFIKLPKGGADNLRAALPEQDDSVWIYQKCTQEIKRKSYPDDLTNLWKERKNLFFD